MRTRPGSRSVRGFSKADEHDADHEHAAREQTENEARQVHQYRTRPNLAQGCLNLFEVKVHTHLALRVTRRRRRAAPLLGDGVYTLA